MQANSELFKKELNLKDLIIKKLKEDLAKSLKDNEKLHIKLKIPRDHMMHM